MALSETIKTAALVLGLAGSALGFVWRSGARVALVEDGVAVLNVFKKDQEKLNAEQAQKITRTETMVEMIVKGMGMRPPPKE